MTAFRLGVLLLAICVLPTTADRKCTSQGGRCQVNTKRCRVAYTSGLCNGARNRQCCLEKDRKCLAENGVCQLTSKRCKGAYKSRLCGGPTNRKCCTSIGGSDKDRKCKAEDGVCQLTSKRCNGVYKSKLCGGPKNRKCCTPRGGSGKDRKCLAEDGVCQLTSKRCNGVYKSNLCGGPANRKCCAPRGKGALTNSEALRILANNGMTWSATGSCNNRNNPKCTSFTGMRRTTLTGLVKFKNRLPRNCDINVTGGTEVGHSSGTFSHANGYKIDISLRSCVRNYINNRFERIANRGSDPQWKDPDGNIYALERDHWDITYF